MLGPLRPRTGLGQLCLGQGALRPTRTNVRMTTVHESINSMFDSLAFEVLRAITAAHQAYSMHASRAAASTTMPRAGRSGAVRKIVQGLHHARHIIVVTSGCERSSTSADAAMSGAAMPLPLPTAMAMAVQSSRQHEQIQQPNVLRQTVWTSSQSLLIARLAKAPGVHLV